MSTISDRKSSHRTLAGLLRERAADRPDHGLYTFLADGEEEAGGLTYRELDRRARALAAWLQDAGCRGERALLLFPPGLDFITAFFGCLYAGAAAVPAYPPRLHRTDERLVEIFRDARPHAVLTTSALLGRLATAQGELAGGRLVAVDQIPDSLAEDWREPDLGAGDLAFLQYTSGSTAAPKGVLVTHGNLLDNEERIRRAFGQSAESVVVGWLPLYHDMGLIGNVLQPLWSGGRCILMSPQAFLQRPARWLEAISRYRATTSGGPNFAYDLCVRRVGPEQRAALDLSSWRVAFNGAEPVRRATFDRFAAAFAPCGFRREAFVPCYGLAEATLLVAAGPDGSSTEGPVSCGAPVGGEVVVVDPETGAAVAPGVEGEIWVGGPGVAAGYWNRPAETAETFGAMLPNGGGPYLRTGDLGFLREGELFVTGRRKDLIILRGRNHHPQDLELTAERAHPALQPGGAAAFSVDSGAEERLVLALEIVRARSVPVRVRPGGEEALAEDVAAEVRRALAAEHEVSVHEVVLLAPGALPRTSSGKVRRGACRAAWQAGTLEVTGRSVAVGADPGALAGWLLRAIEKAGDEAGEEIDPDLPLVARGLDSLGAVELAHRIAAATGVELSPTELLGGVSLRALAVEVAARRGAAARRAETPRLVRRTPSAAGTPLSFGQQRLWFLHRMDPRSSTDNLTGRYRLSGLVRLPALARALGEIVRRHEVLRTVYRQTLASDEPVQIVGPPLPVSVPLVDLAGLPAAMSEAGEAEAARLAAEEAERPFDLACGPVLRAAALRLSPREHLMLTTLHHIACDGWSAGVLLGELGVLYRAFAAGRPSPLPELPVQYADFAAWQRRWLDGPMLQEQLRFWRERLAGAPPVLALPSDRPRPAVRSGRGCRLPVAVPAATAARLASLAQREGMTLYALLLALFQALLGRLTGAEDLIVGSPVAGRRHAETRGLIGFFVNTLALRADLAGDPPLGAHLARTRQAVLDAFAHQDLPFERLVEELRPERSLSHAPIFQVLFVFQNTPGGTLELPGLRVDVLPPAPSTHFDLELELAEEGGGLRGALGYATDLFDDATAERLLGHLETLLGAAAEGSAAAPLSELLLLPDAERRELEGLSHREPAAVEPVAVGAEAPVPAEAEAVAGLWAELLGGGRVEAHENVFVRGAHSLLVTRMAWRLREAFGVELPLRVLFEEPTPAGLARRVAAARAAVEEVPLAPRERPDPLPLSFAQQRLWFEDQREPGSALYNMPAFLVLRGRLDAAALEGAFTAVVQRHEVLRTTFPDTRGRPRQAIAPPSPFRLPRVDLTGLPVDRREEEALRQGEAEARRPFDLAAGPLLRAFLLRLNRLDQKTEHRLVVNMHHIVSDGWSLAVLVEELGAFYADPTAPLPELPVQYADFTLWQRERHVGGAVAADLAYWRDRLADAPAALELPTDRLRPAVRGTRGATVPVEASRELAERLAVLGHGEGATLFMVLLAAFQVLLSRETGAEDLAVGTPAAGRPHRETEGLIGFFVNTLVVRVDLGGSPSFKALAARVREAVLGATAHQDLPFERLVEELVPQRDTARTPLVQVLFSLEEKEPEATALAGLEMTPVRLSSGTAKADLSLTLSRGPAGLAGSIEYATDLFDRTTVQRLARRFERLLDAMAEAPDEPIDTLPLLGAAERHQVVVEWAAGSPMDPPRERFVHELFAQQAARTPDLLALSGGSLRLTYAELRRRAGRLAWRLAACGVGPDVLVAVLLERSPELIVTFLAILEAGGAFVPLDPAHPVERLAFLLQDSGARVLVAAKLPEGLEVGGVGVVGAEDIKDNQESPSLESLLSLNSFGSFSPDQLAYVLYTSGSTGLPKGVFISHANLTPVLVWSQKAFGFGTHTRVLQTLPHTFDFGVFEILTTLLAGGTLFLRGEAEHSDVGSYLRETRLHAVNTLHATPSFFRAVAAAALAAGERLSTLETLHLGGEALSAGMVEEVFAVAREQCRVFNGYGPTEAAIHCALFEVSRDWSPRGLAPVVPIGRPSSESRLYLLDRRMQPVPAGVPGELLVGGAGLARGYLRRPGLTAERFVPDPFGPPGGRLYHTGDSARWLADGILEFLGRLDGQVKLRGFRIETGEIEAAAMAFPGVEQAVVLLREDPPGPRLVLYLEFAGARDTAALRAFLRSRLPEPMIPAAFVWLDALPLTANGKLDRRALARMEAPAESRSGERGSAVPRTPIEEGLAGIWREVLGVAAGRDDDFFELGGHSLLATQVASRVRESFGVELPLRDFFAAPRLTDLAAHVEDARRRGAGLAAPPVVPVPRDSFPHGLPLSYSQEWMWVAGQLNPEAAAYNAPVAAHLDGALDPGALARALHEVARRHEVLRTVFTVQDGTPVQVIQPAAPFALPVVDLSGLAGTPDRTDPSDRTDRSDLKAREALALAAAEAARPFDLEAGPPARALLVRRGAEDHLLLFSPHHLVTDGWSAGVLLREIAALYGGESLPELPVQYGDYAVWQRRWLTGEPLATLAAWWREQLAGAPPFLELPVDRSGATPPGGLGERLPFRPETGQVEALRILARGHGSTLFAVLLAAWTTLLARITRQDDLVVGTPVANRTRRELEGLIGYFVNDVPLRTRLGGDPPFLELLDRVHATALGAWAHQDLPLQKILQAVAGASGGAPLFRTWFQLQNMRLPDVQLPGVRLSPVEVDAPAATFDLELITLETDGGLTGHLVYNRELFRRETAESLLHSFLVLLAEIAADPARRLAELPLLTVAERMTLIHESAAVRSCPGETTLHRAFEAVAAAHPKAPAVTYEGESLTYAELNRRADILAKRLRAQGVGPESRVGLCLERSLELVIGILGVLKSGASYVPLDSAYPRERLDLLQEDARLHAVVAREESVFTITKLLTIPQAAGEAGPDHPAYIIYTSGSTGRPKGVMVTHRQAARLFEATRGFGFGPADVWTLFHSYAFDFSVWEIWGALLHGGRLVVVPHGVSRSPADFLDLLSAEKVTVLNQTPSAFYQLLRAQEEWGDEVPPLALRCVIFGGEALEPAKLRPWFDRHGDARPVLVNMYGITETTVHVTERPLARGDAGSPDSVLGRPLADLRVSLLDGALGPVPPGGVGEICVGGGGVARGYLFRPELTAERFVPDPFAAERGEPGARLYRSGDLARRRTDGELIYLGRADRQLKVRGFRIEPGEVEAALLRHPGVAEAAVFTRKLSAEDVRLVAGIVCRNLSNTPAPSPAELREHLLALLPEAWVPGHFVPLPALPLTAHGKLDREALADLVEKADRTDPSDRSDPSDPAQSAPLTPLEEHLAALWTGLLGVDHVERDDNFFTLGGHSLLVTWIAARLREAFDIPPPMRSFFERPTVGNLALGVLRELVAKLPSGRLEEIFALVEGLPEAEVARQVESKRGDAHVLRRGGPQDAVRHPVWPPSTVPKASNDPDLPEGLGLESTAKSQAMPSPAQGGHAGCLTASCGPPLLAQLAPMPGVRVRVRDLLATLPPPGAPEPPLRVTTMAFPTCNRSAILERGLASHAEAAREHGRTLRFAVLDDSPDPAVGEDYRRRLSALRRRLGIEIVYAGPAEKRRFADLLVAEGLPADAVTAALFDAEGVGTPIGTNRNAVLLQGVGEGVVSVDDDTLARGGPPPEAEPGIELLTGTVPDWAFLSAREPGSIRGFTHRAEAMAAVDLRSVDLAGVHEELLGRDVSAWAHEFDPETPVATGRADAAFLHSLESGGRVRVTTNGWVGDCGWRNPIFYMLQTGASWRHLVRSAESYRAVTASKEIVRFLPRPAVGNAESFMATMFWGFDHRTLLPPFPPVLWGEDRLYGLTLQLAFPTARAGHLPWVALHDPVEQRGFWPGEMVRTASGIDHSRLLASLLAGFAPDPHLDPADGLRRLGRFIQDLGRMEPGAFDELARRKVRDRAEAFAAGLEARLAGWREQQERGDRPEGGPLWAEDVRRYLDLLRRHMADPDFVLPLDLLYHREPEEARRLAQRLLVHHGRLLEAWPDLIEVVRGLKARGRSLAEEVP
jgi:amino acid adenylation domain-containing protein